MILGLIKKMFSLKLLGCVGIVLSLGAVVAGLTEQKERILKMLVGAIGLFLSLLVLWSSSNSYDRAWDTWPVLQALERWRWWDKRWWKGQQ